ncbi:expressed protein [Batrachochytrium dendrobatidis JAM81]|uniref:Expressed protein n=1 Tax=Batrachochytrium dendrobatidis (strain JAM81 / FGSC 10211) TaxID=684364 RepID=F4NVB0_BATDJ|nr:uncharacterized protein BATDEDRAFT_84807 [Batrachochytrium dendrobatidis JAM81]EGF83263.1 expressed protein [Batrachochytrium dendrobatidis JAM81]KAJ8325547.1 hypothetical protein O5D80_005758 [Batrachochytrium dendrobatidis]KAK5671475.1 hypothetical protein QVD99_002182 [Batrachochytrium dendrobatidis]|eukprot:XP_006676038.1 expressed protein [Batrachochytrium dendrobatidis JAM81]
MPLDFSRIIDNLSVNHIVIAPAPITTHATPQTHANPYALLGSPHPFPYNIPSAFLVCTLILTCVVFAGIMITTVMSVHSRRLKSSRKYSSSSQQQSASKPTTRDQQRHLSQSSQLTVQGVIHNDNYFPSKSTNILLERQNTLTRYNSTSKSRIPPWQLPQQNSMVIAVATENETYIAPKMPLSIPTRKHSIGLKSKSASTFDYPLSNLSISNLKSHSRSDLSYSSQRNLISGRSEPSNLELQQALNAQRLFIENSTGQKLDYFDQGQPGQSARSLYSKEQGRAAKDEINSVLPRLSFQESSYNFMPEQEYADPQRNRINIALASALRTTRLSVSHLPKTADSHMRAKERDILDSYWSS